ncbi:glycosyl transferase [Desulfitobacterium hafniense]|uniref:Glycosyl transferase n=1 Tax=Desulfitobacterium hafniense TaxID=49338 RepID=A0A0W1JQJ4_DESHA|nr:glycosyltransferase family 2 protein [Desulfitobacterium hafniense]KTE93856.1 glycosyl transferase [Desulfitobacterium hafniense]
MEKISFVIPCYRSANSISSVVNEIVNTVKKQAEYTYEIILVSDHSPDDVFRVIKQLAVEDSNITGIEFSKNFGQHAALMAGYRECTGDIIISLDDDGQTPADELFSLVDKINEGYDVVYASYSSIRQNAFRKWGTKVNALMMEKLLGKPDFLDTTSYFACRSYIVDEIIKYQSAFPYVGGLVFRTTRNIANVTVKHRERLGGSSGYNIRRLISLWMNGFTAFSVKPLRIASFSGAICAITGFMYGLYIIIHRLLDPTTQIGWSSTMAVMLFIGGMLMLMLGLIGEYIGRIYICINDSPQYVIREVINKKDCKVKQAE